MSMLNQFRFIGYDVKKVAFADNNVESEGGFLNLSSNIDPDFSFHIDEDEDCIFSFLVDANVEARDREDKDAVVFTCLAQLELSFACLKGKENNDEQAVEDCLKEHGWFFQNFIDVSVKTSFEKILSDTRFDKVNIPPCSSFEMHE